MGGSQSKQSEYGVFVGNKGDGETQILKHVDSVDIDIFSEKHEYETLLQGFETSVKLYGSFSCLGSREISLNDNGEEVFGDYKFKSYKEVYSYALDLSSSLVNNDFCPLLTSQSGIFKMLGIYTKNREEWLITDLACHINAITVVTIYDSLGDLTIEFILNQTNLTTIVVDKKTVNKIVKIKQEKAIEKLANLILLDLVDDSIIETAKEHGLNIFYYMDLLKLGADKPFNHVPAEPTTIATLCYTSGTTDIPKGSMLSHKSLTTNVCSFLNKSIGIDTLNPSDVHLSYLPLAHVMEKDTCYGILFKGGSIGFTSAGTMSVFEDIQIIKPTVFVGVPLMYMRIFHKLRQKFYQLNYLQKSLVDRALSTKLTSLSATGQVNSVVWDNLVFGNMKDTLGGRVRLLITGSAPIDSGTLDFLRVCFSCPLIEGYGQTECCGAVTVTKISERADEHVGGPITSVEIKLVDVPKLNYFATDKDKSGNPLPRGEVCVRGPVVFSGYFEDPENTALALDKDGWLHTGDIGELLPNLALRIIDRKKNIFKLSNGEYIAPEKIENYLSNSKYISQIFVHGDSFEDYVIAIIVPVETVLRELIITEYNLNPDIEVDITKYAKDKKLIKIILTELNETGRAQGLKGFEVVRKLMINLEGFSIENGLLTPTSKLIRTSLMAKFADKLKSLYEEDLY